MQKYPPKSFAFSSVRCARGAAPENRVNRVNPPNSLILQETVPKPIGSGTPKPGYFGALFAARNCPASARPFGTVASAAACRRPTARAPGGWRRRSVAPRPDAGTRSARRCRWSTLFARVHSSHLAAVLGLAGLPEVAMLAAAQVRTPVGCDAAGAHGVLRARVDGAGVSAIRVTHAIGHGDELRGLGGHQRHKLGFPCDLGGDLRVGGDRPPGHRGS